ncbi:MAG: GNAT family N-acetyltransferase, partial [Actinobacteria bacterium]|nr:GNAT family N-acetyltransferase [Actinomycetota bacterium]
MKRALGDGYELDDDPMRIDLDAVHRYLSEESYWAKGRSREVQDELIENAARVVGLYHG